MGGSSRSFRTGLAVFGAAVLVVAVADWSVIAGLGVALGAAVCYLVPIVRRAHTEWRVESAEKREQIAYRADRQHHWATLGDSRGVYGADEGVELMRPIKPERAATAGTEDEPIAAVARTPGELETLLADKPAGWHWAAFASVVLQRHEAMVPRLRDCQLGYSAAKTARAYSGVDVGRFVLGRLQDLGDLMTEVESFMLAPGFMGAFGPRDYEDDADPDAVLHVAHRLMDYHERFLVLAERWRDFGVPSEYAELSRDVLAVLTEPLRGYRRFVEDFVSRVDHFPDLMLPGAEVVRAEPVELHMDYDDETMSRITERVRAALRD